MTDKIASVIAELSSAADLLITAEVARTKAATLTDLDLLQAAEAKFLADFNPANCGHLAELIRTLRDAYAEKCK